MTSVATGPSKPSFQCLYLDGSVRKSTRTVSPSAMSCLPRATGLSQNDPERLGPLRAEILPAVRRAAVEQRADRPAEPRRDPARGGERRGGPPRLDLRPHARREVRLLPELPLLQLALGAQALDALAERGHAPPSAGQPAGASPARDASARATNTRVIFFR